jgi:2-deoxystreptamine N-acetyl-D-glucosaminyltransferase/2-deoxystreptamine glucosyltransferase
MNWLFRTAAAVILPYVSGWNSGVLASAFGYGCPVIATRVGGFDEVVEDGRTGLLVPPGDVTALAAAMDRVLGDPALAGSLAEGAQAAGRRASWSEVAAMTRAAYDRASAARATHG